jgi:PKD repeat protein
VTVADVDAPTVSEPSVSPSPAIADQPAVFTVTASADPDGHRIVQYTWTFGDGTTATTTQATVNKTYAVPGQFVVMVTVTDDLGRTASAVTDPAITVVNATPNNPVARFTVNPSQPKVDQEAVFDARSSTAGTRAVIVTYSWNFGDGSTVVTSSPTIGHAFDEARTFPVTLTVTDNGGRSSTVGQQVIVTD